MISIATGSLHCVACTDSGEVFTWGDNDEGQLGDGSTNAIQRPRLVAALQVNKDYIFFVKSIVIPLLKFFREITGKEN